MVRLVRAAARRTADDVAAGPASGVAAGPASGARYDRRSRRRRSRATVADRQRAARVLRRQLAARRLYVPRAVRTTHTHLHRYKPNSITLASSELAPNMFGASFEQASVMEFGFIRSPSVRRGWCF